MLDGRGDSLLHKAVSRFRAFPAITEALIKAGADPNMKNRDGYARLLCLRDTDRHSVQLVDVLLRAGADPKTVDRDGKTLFFYMLPSDRLP